MLYLPTIWSRPLMKLPIADKTSDSVRYSSIKMRMSWAPAVTGRRSC